MIQQHFGRMQRNKEKEGMGNGKENILERLNGSGLETNSLITFLKVAVMKIKAMLFSTFVTAAQN